MDTPNIRTVDNVALLVLALGEEVSAKVLNTFNKEEIKQLTKSMSEQRDIKESDAISAIGGFFEDYKTHSGIIGGSRQYVVGVLNKTLKGNIAKDLVAEFYGDELRKYAEPLSWIPAKILSESIRDEHVSMQALLIAHLPAEHAELVLQQFTDEECHELLLQISKDQVISQVVTEQLMELIDKCRSDYDAGGLQSIDGTKIAAGIINRYSGNKSELFEYFKIMDPNRASALENALFDFDAVFKQEASLIEKVSNRIRPEQWAMALKGIEESKRAVVIGAFTSRVAKQLTDDIEMLGSVSKSQVTKARNEILDVIREMQSQGDIELVLGDEEKLT